MFPPSMTAMMPYMRPPMNMLPFLMQSQAAAAQMQAHYAMANKSMKPMSRSGGPSSVRSLKAVNDILAAQKIKAEIAEMTANPSPPLLYSPHTNVSQAGGAPGHPLGQMSASLPTEGQKMATVKKARPEKSYICDFPGCSASFGRRFCLKRHQKRHTRVRPHACTYKGCDKKFAETSTLKRHIQAHLGSRPYKCGAPGCERRFADRANVCRHEKSMHNCMYTTVRSRATRSPNNSILPVEETAAVGLASSSSSPSSPGTAAPVVAASPAAPVDLNPRGAES